MMTDFAIQAQGIFLAAMIGLIGGYWLRGRRNKKKHRDKIRLVEDWRKDNARK